MQCGRPGRVFWPHFVRIVRTIMCLMNDVYRYMRDSLMEYARTAVIPLENGIGRYVRVQLEFDAKWMLISEVQFQSGRWPH